MKGNGRHSEEVRFDLDGKRAVLYASDDEADEMACFRRRIRELTGGAIPIPEKTDQKES